MKLSKSCGIVSLTVALVGAALCVRSDAPYRAKRNVYSQPDLSGIWQAMTTANWDIEEHGAEPAPYPKLVGVYLAEPAGVGVVEGGAIPYKPEALAKRDKYRAERLHPDPLLIDNGVEDFADPEAKCFEGGVPRATYMSYPFQILQNKDAVLFAYEYAGTARVIHLGENPAKTRAKLVNTDSWMGQSVGRFDGDTLVVDDQWFSHDIWLDRSGNFYGPNAHLTERYTPMSAYHMRYEVTIDDPDDFTRPWKLSMILYKHVEANAQLLEFQCIPFADEFRYGSLYKKKPTQ